MRLFLLFILNFLVTCIFANPLDSIRTEKTSEGIFVIHKVEENETLYSLSRRYKSDIGKIIATNNIQNQNINVTQILRIPIVSDKFIVQKSEKVSDNTEANFTHIVKQGENLYRLSKMYGVAIEDLKRINDLSSDEIDLGMVLKIKPSKNHQKIENPTKKTEKKTDRNLVVTSKPSDDKDFQKYIVQAGDNLRQISKKLGVSIQNIKEWNNLKNNKIKIQQELFYKLDKKQNKSIEKGEGKNTSDPFVVVDKDGFKQTHQEGIASVIKNMNTDKFLALHRSLPTGTQLRIQNLMNKKYVYVKVVGRLPNTGENKNLLLRLSQVAYQKLGILDARARVEVSYFEE